MRAKYPSTCDSLNARTPENVTLQRVLLSWLRGRLVRSSLARLIPPRQPRTHVRRRRGNERTVILAALWKNYFPLERHWGGGGGRNIRDREGERGRRGGNAWYSNCGCAQTAWKRAGQPRVFFFFFFFLSSSAEQIAYRRRFSFTLTRLPMVTIGPYLNTRRKY